MTGAAGSAALASGAAVAWSNAVLPRVSGRYGWGREARGAATFAFCVADAGLTRARIPAVIGVPSGLALAAAGLARTSPVAREAPPDLARWVLLDIPFGTAIPEELLFRGALTPRLEEGFGRRAGAIVGPLMFGLWHVGAAKSARDPVFPTIVVTSLAGASWDALTRRTRRLWPAMAAHWAVNSAGAILSSGSVFSGFPVTDT